ncbi:MAG: hypothetical protein KDC38_08210, partial [Planctomycetes bacterium]|nr:hypothetical protein [Planctomycetota bacterium]
LALLEDRDSRILRMRYGLDTGDPMTLKEIGERVSLSRERVRQIENEALKKLYAIVSGEEPEPEPTPKPKAKAKSNRRGSGKSSKSSRSRELEKA